MLSRMAGALMVELADVDPVAAGGRAARDFIADALAGDLTLELREGQQHTQSHPTHAARRVERLGDGHEGDALGIEQLNELSEVCERAGEPIDLVDHDDIDHPRSNRCQEALQCRPLERAAGKPAVIKTFSDQTPALVGLAFDVGVAPLLVLP